MSKDVSMIGKTIVLRGVTLKGKNRVREQGDRWTVFGETDRVLFAPGKPGPWLYVVPAGMPHDHKAGRWIHKTNDADFHVSDQVG